MINRVVAGVAQFGKLLRSEAAETFEEWEETHHSALPTASDRNGAIDAGCFIFNIADCT